MKYPYIGQINGATKVLFTANKEGYELDSHQSEQEKLFVGWNESDSKNITAEHLANTYGEVKSKAHAEFIKLLAENAGVDVFPQLLDANHFVIKGKLSFHNCERITSSELKQITIPLPPECETEDEWPKVNDEVSLRYRFDSKQVMYTGELLYLSSNHIIIKTENGNDCHCIRSEWDIEKTKTPEQELRDELSDLAFNQFNDDSYDLTHNSYYLAEQLISKYNITKKPQ